MLFRSMYLAQSIIGQKWAVSLIIQLDDGPVGGRALADVQMLACQLADLAMGAFQIAFTGGLVDGHCPALTAGAFALGANTFKAAIKFRCNKQLAHNIPILALRAKQESLS